MNSSGLSLSDWAETNFRLRERSSARPGPLRLWKYQRAWLDSIGDRHIPSITVVKPAQIGFSTCMTAAIGGYAATDPCSAVLLVPTPDDARRYVVDVIEPSFAETPVLRGLIRRNGQNRLMTKTFKGGGSLEILAARSTSSLRAHAAKVLFIDDAEGIERSSEGDPIALAERLTRTYSDRKIVIGAMPTLDDFIEERYAQSDRRIFEVPCMHCGTFFEILWRHIKWPKGEPEKAVCVCPFCDQPTEERHKAKMVAAGDWQITRPEVRDHAGFRINALVSPIMAWPNLAADYLRAKRKGPLARMMFANMVEGLGLQGLFESIDDRDDDKIRKPAFGS